MCGLGAAWIWDFLLCAVSCELARCAVLVVFAQMVGWVCLHLRRLGFLVWFLGLSVLLCTCGLRLFLGVLRFVLGCAGADLDFLLCRTACGWYNIRSCDLLWVGDLVSCDCGPG